LASPRRAFDWLFRDRRTGKVVVAQRPNLALSLFLGATAVRWVFDPTGTAATIVNVVAILALAWWALDEVVRGVNPFRRGLGAVVLAITLVGLVAR
jgi:hypothetical protein